MTSRRVPLPRSSNSVLSIVSPLAIQCIFPFPMSRQTSSVTAKRMPLTVSFQTTSPAFLILAAFLWIDAVAFMVNFEQILRDAWPPPPTQSNVPHQAKSKIAAQMFARALGLDATHQHAIEMLEQDLGGAASFLDAANELLKADSPYTKVSFDMQNSQGKMELGHLCAFVDSRLSNMLRSTQGNA